jgi:hypothetical protein
MFIARMHSPKYLPPWASIVGVVVQFSGMEWSWVKSDRVNFTVGSLSGNHRC